MKELVQTMEALQNFNGVLLSVYGSREYKFTIDEHLRDDVEKHVVYDGFGNAVATVSFKMYDPAISDLEKEHDFTKEPSVIDAAPRVAEIGSVAILDSVQGQGYFNYIMDIIADYAKRNEIGCFVSLIDARFYLGLKMNYGVPIERLAAKREYKGHVVYPASLIVTPELLNKASSMRSRKKPIPAR